MGAHLKHGPRWHRALSLEGTDRRVNDLDLIHEYEASQSSKWRECHRERPITPRACDWTDNKDG
jgi:hypothetical protein